jgi:hypothetical protein
MTCHQQLGVVADGQPSKFPRQSVSVFDVLVLAAADLKEN